MLENWDPFESTAGTVYTAFNRCVQNRCYLFQHSDLAIQDCFRMDHIAPPPPSSSSLRWIAAAAAAAALICYAMVIFSIFLRILKVVSHQSKLARDQFGPIPEKNPLS